MLLVVPPEIFADHARLRQRPEMLPVEAFGPQTAGKLPIDPWFGNQNRYISCHRLRDLVDTGTKHDFPLSR